MEKNVFDKIMELCEEKGISQRELGRMANISLGTISKWKTRIPRTDKLQDVADVLNVDVNYLLGNSQYKNQEDMYKSWDSTNSEHKKTLSDGSIVEFYDNDVTFHSTGGSITYTNYDPTTRQIAESIISDQKLKDMFDILKNLPPKQFDAVYNLLLAMDDF